MNTGDFRKLSHAELIRDHDFIAILIGVSVICPITGNLAEISFNSIRVEDRDLYILCNCEAIHEVGGF